MTGGGTQQAKNGNGPRKTFEQKSEDAKKEFGKLGETMVELSAHAVEVVHSSMDSIRAAARGAELAGEKVEAKAAEIVTLAQEVRDAHAELDSRGQHLDTQATLAAREAENASAAAQEAKETVAGIKADINSAVDSRLDEKIGLEAVVDGEKKKLSGRDVVLRVWGNSKKALESAGAALRSAEGAESAAQSASEAAKDAEGKVDEAKQHAEAAKASAEEAKAEAKKATDAVATLTGMIGDLHKRLNLLLGLQQGQFEDSDVPDVVAEIEKPLTEGS